MSANERLNKYFTNICKDLLRRVVQLPWLLTWVDVIRCVTSCSCGGNLSLSLITLCQMSRGMVIIESTTSGMCSVNRLGPHVHCNKKNVPLSFLESAYGYWRRAGLSSRGLPSIGISQPCIFSSCFQTCKRAQFTVCLSEEVCPPTRSLSTAVSPYLSHTAVSLSVCLAFHSSIAFCSSTAGLIWSNYMPYADAIIMCYRNT